MMRDPERRRIFRLVWDDESETPRDWENPEETPPEHLRHRWETREREGFLPRLCFYCEREVRTDSLLCPYCGESLLASRRLPGNSWWQQLLQRWRSLWRRNDKP